MHNYTSPETLREICSAFAQQAEHAAVAPDSAAGSAGNDHEGQNTRAHAASSADSASSFATLATTFVNTLAVSSPLDLGRDWLLHRLHCILVNHELPKPGEIEVMRADIRARAETSIFSSTETALLMGGVDRVLQGFTLWPVREAGRVRSETTGGGVSP